MPTGSFPVACRVHCPFIGKKPADFQKDSKEMVNPLIIFLKCQLFHVKHEFVFNFHNNVISAIRAQGCVGIAAREWRGPNRGLTEISDN